MTIRVSIVLGLLQFCAVRFAPAQPIPSFFGGGAVAYDPEISTVNSGAIMNAQATVSADQKYVTINMQGSKSNLQALQTFPVSTVLPQGFVGGANLSANASAPTPTGASASGGGGSGPAAAPSPEQIQRQARGWILARQGIFLVKPLE